MKFIAIIIMCALAFVSTAGAHVGGFTYEATVNNYFVDIGASKLTLLPNELTLFEFNLYPTSDPNNLADFDNVYITIGDDQKVHLSTFVHRPGGSLTVLSYAFPNSGTYQMSARFQKAGETMAEVSFPVQVQSTGMNQNYIKIGILALLVGLAIGYAASRVWKTSGLTQ